MYACVAMVMGRTKLLVSMIIRLLVRPIAAACGFGPPFLFDPLPIVFVSLATAVACTMAFALSRSRGRRRSSTGCRIAKDQDVIITTISIQPHGVKLGRRGPLVLHYSFLVDGDPGHARFIPVEGPLLGLDTVMCM